LQRDVIILKFGSSVLRTPADLPNAVHEIYRWYRQGNKVVVVVSAIGDTTDQLLAEARRLTATPEPYSTAELLATGERTSAALFGVALDRSGIPVRVLNPGEIGLTVTGSPLDGELTEVHINRVRELLAQYSVLVILDSSEQMLPVARTCSAEAARICPRFISHVRSVPRAAG
jgi:homoserine dehydrogenase